MGLTSPGGQNLLDFLEMRQVLSTYDGDLRDPLWWPQERPVPLRVALGRPEIVCRRCQGLRPCVDSGLEPKDSSSLLSWILGYCWSLPRGVSSGLEWGQARALSSGAVAAGSRFPSRQSTDLWLSLKAFPRGFPMRLPHRAVPLATAA